MESTPIKSQSRGLLSAQWTRVLILALLFAGVMIVTMSDTLYSALVVLLAAVEEIITAHPVSGASLFVAFAALSAMLAFVSTALITPVAVHTWGEPLSLLLLWSGWTLGGVCSYGIGRYLGRPVVASLTSGALLSRYEKQISMQAPFGLVLLFQMALPSEVPGYLLGLVRYRFAKFVTALSLAELPFALATIYLGASFIERRALVFLAVGALVVVFSVWTFYRLQKRLAEAAGSTDRR
jgi:uncharacterized membrane protein YdjX (TVP38/TMEM64 family)